MSENIDKMPQMGTEIASALRIKRIYLPIEPTDGYRILIDRLWPRGISRTAAEIDEWAKDVAPSTKLRKWFDHKVENFEEFRCRYELELNDNPLAGMFALHCRELLEKGRVTLLYGARSITCNHAIILRDWILKKSQSSE